MNAISFLFQCGVSADFAGFALNLYIAFNETSIFTILILSKHEYERPFYLLESLCNLFFKSSKVFVIEAFYFIVYVPAFT